MAGRYYRYVGVPSVHPFNAVHLCVLARYERENEFSDMVLMVTTWSWPARGNWEEDPKAYSWPPPEPGVSWNGPLVDFVKNFKPLPPDFSP